MSDLDLRDAHYDTAFIKTLGIPIESIISDLHTVADAFRLQSEMDNNVDANRRFKEAIKNLFIELVLQAIHSTTILGKRKVINYKTFGFVSQEELLREYAAEQLEMDDYDVENRRKRYRLHLLEIADHVFGHLGNLKIMYYGQKIIGDANPETRKETINIETIARIIKEVLMLSAQYDPEFYQVMTEYFERQGYGSVYGYANFLEMCFEDLETIRAYGDARKVDNSAWKDFKEVFFFFIRWAYTDAIEYEKMKETFQENRPVADLQIILETVFNNLYSPINILNRTQGINASREKMEIGIFLLIDKLYTIYGKDKVLRMLLKFFDIPFDRLEKLRGDNAELARYQEELKQKLNQKIRILLRNAEAYQYFNYKGDRTDSEGIRKIFYPERES